MAKVVERISADATDRDREAEYDELVEAAENAGIAELLEVYGSYAKVAELCMIYLRQTVPQSITSTTDSTE